MMRRCFSKTLLYSFLCLFFIESAWAAKLVLWHSYRGSERTALEKVVANWNAKNASTQIESLAIPYDAFADRITAAIPRGKGPDLFIFAHDRLGGWAESQLIEPLEFWVDDALKGQFLPVTFDAVSYKDSLYALPVAAKSTVLFYNKKLVSAPPKTTDELVEMAKKLTSADKGAFGLVYENANYYYHSCWNIGFGASVFDKQGKPSLNTPEAIAGLQFAAELDRKHAILPKEITNVLVTTLFNQGKAAMVINGPWFRGEIDAGVDYGVALLPEISSIHKPARPFMSSEGVLLSSKCAAKEEAFEFMKYLASTEAGLILALEGQQTSANKAVWDDPKVKADPLLPVFRQQLDAAVPMPNGPEMLSVWTPATTAMQTVIIGGGDPKAALDEAQVKVLESLSMSKK